MGPRRILLVYLLLFAAAVPWYWNLLPLAGNALVWGMPAWAFGALVGSFSISLFSGWILWRPWACEVDDRPAPSDGTDEPPADAKDASA